MLPQSKLWSLFESACNTLSSFVVSVWVQWWLFPLIGIYVSLQTNIMIVCIFMAISLVRSYLIRRFFNWLVYRRVQ